MLSSPSKKRSTRLRVGYLKRILAGFTALVF
jgi:hypothetical protein